MELDHKTHETIKSFFFKFKEMSIRKGEKILQPQDFIDYIFFLSNGKIKQYLINDQGEEVTFHLFEPGAYFPIMLILSNSANRYFFEATEDSILYKAPKTDVLNFLKTNPDVLLELSVRLSEGLIGLLLKTESLLNDNSYEKVHNLISFFKNKYGKPSQNGIEIDLDLTHQEIASWLGLQRETVSRQLEKMQKEGVIRIEERRMVWGI